MKGPGRSRVPRSMGGTKGSPGVFEQSPEHDELVELILTAARRFRITPQQACDILKGVFDEDDLGR